MNHNKSIKNVIFDFDGVILESNDVKIKGFYNLFLPYGEEKASLASEYFKNNAGLSRYDVIKYFFNVVMDEKYNEQKLLDYATKYSNIVKNEVVKSDFVDGFLDFINKNKEYNFFIISSSDEKDLKYICDKINITQHFKEILGSPTKKAENIKALLSKYNLRKTETLYIGDSKNDYDATLQNEIIFVGRNSGVFNFNTIDNIVVVNNLNEINKKIKEIKC